jgi:hypothetical protein
MQRTAECNTTHRRRNFSAAPGAVDEFEWELHASAPAVRLRCCGHEKKEPVQPHIRNFFERPLAGFVIAGSIHRSKPSDPHPFS